MNHFLLIAVVRHLHIFDGLDRFSNQKIRKRKNFVIISEKIINIIFELGR